MDSAKNERWIFPFKKFNMVSVNLRKECLKINFQNKEINYAFN